MKKLLNRVLFCLVLAAFAFCGTLLADREKLNDGLIRLHVVANSDTEVDQTVKLRVRDAILCSIQEDLKAVADVDEARTYLTENLPKLEKIANAALSAAGVSDRAVVSLCREAFDTRVYETFTLPAGVYEALRVTIGAGEGHNWWCVAFPTLCLPATTREFSDTAAGAGFPEGLTQTLAKGEGHIRFFLLDALGALEAGLFS